MQRVVAQLTLLLACASLSVSTLRAESRPAADLIIAKAKVWTEDKSRPTAQAVAVLGDRIVAVGSIDEVNAWRETRTRVINAGGKLLLQGFNDAHVHFVNSGLQLESAQLSDATSKEDFARRIGERAKMTPNGEWILGGDWDETKWNPPAIPTKDLIDPLTPDTPVFVSRYDGHIVLRLAGISAQTPDPAGGVIVRDSQGNPTGALNATMDMAARAIPPLSHDRRLRIVQRAMQHALSLGVTSARST